jgi:hypothetical protein
MTGARRPPPFEGKPKRVKKSKAAKEEERQ